ncbi:cadherin domain-containing protein, partial [Catenovulum sp. 2E275]|nr:cadherin domain-containing protein [Catenovulum sp. 2E275]
MDTEYKSAAIFTHSKLQTHIKAALLCSAAIQLPVAVVSSTLANAETLNGAATHKTVNQQALDYVQSRLINKAITVTRDPSWGRLVFLQCGPADGDPRNTFCSGYTTETGCSAYAPLCAWDAGTPSNNPPSFNSSASTNFAENGTGTVLDVNADNGDGGSNDSGVTYSLSGTDALLFNIDSSSGVITFKTAPDYESPADNGGNNIYNITVTANDGESSNNTATQNVAITVTDIDEAAPSFENSTPSENTINHNQAVFNLDINEGGTVYAIVVVDGAFAPNAAQVKAGVDYDMGSGRSAEVISSANVTLNSGSYSGTITLTGLTASTAYDIYFIAEDDEGTPNLQSSPTKLDITTTAAPNTAPVFANLDGSPSFTEGGTAVVLDSNVTVSDTELDALNSSAGNYNNASLTIVRNGGANSEDVFANNGLLGTLTEGNGLTYNGTSVGTVTTNSSGTLVLTFNSNATSAIVDSVLQSLTYANTSDVPPNSVTLNYSFNDGSLSSTGTNQAIVSIISVNDSPTASARLGTASTKTLLFDIADNTSELTNGFLGATSSEARTNIDALCKAQFEEKHDDTSKLDGSGTVKAHALISLSETDEIRDMEVNYGVPNLPIYNSGGTKLTNSGMSDFLDGTLSNLNTGASDLFENSGNVKYFWTFSNSDGSVNTNSCAAGTSSSNTVKGVANQNGAWYTLIGSVPCNNALNFMCMAWREVGGGGSIATDLTYTEDTQGSLDLSSIQLGDADNTSLTVTITTTAGIFSDPIDTSGVTATLVNDTTITLVGSISDLNDYFSNSSNISYIGAADTSGDNNALFTIKANDGSGDVILATINVDIIAVNDTPIVANNNGLTLNEGGSGVISSSELLSSDADDAASDLTYTISTLPTKGTLFVDNNSNDILDDGEALSLPNNASFTQTTIDNDSLHYVHNGSETTSDSFVFNLADDEGASVNSQTFAITVNSVNDQPIVTATPANPTFNEGGSAVNLFSSADVSTVDLGEAVTGFSLTVTNVNDGADEKLTIAGTAISLTNGTSGTTASNGLNYTVSVVAATATVTLTNGSLNDATTESILNAIQYNNTKVQPSTSARVVTLTSLKDNGGTANGGDDTAVLSIASTVNISTKPIISDANISISGGTGTSGAFKVGDTVTVTWNNTGAGDNNAGVTGVTVDFSNFGGGFAVVATESAGTWTASYTIVAGSIDATNRNVSISATNTVGSRTTSDTSNATVDNSAPVVTDANISISGATGTGGVYKVGDTVTATWDNTVGGENNSDLTANVTVDFSQFGGGSAVSAANSSGTWTAIYTIVAGSINSFNRNISVTATDNSGNSTTTADTTNATVDNTVPNSLSITTPIESDDIINAAEDNDVLITGTGAEANATVDIAITDGSYTDTAQVTADGSGSWSIAGSELDVSSFNNGNLTVSATQTDTAGNT